MQHESSTEEVVITSAALRKIETRLRARFRAFLRPGERMALKVEEEEDFSFAHLSLSIPDGSYHLDLEGAVIVQDQEENFLVSGTSRDRLLMAIEFLSVALNDYFRGQRRERFHPDWRLYPFEGAQVRFRGGLSYPGLEEKATQLLENDEKDPK